MKKTVSILSLGVALALAGCGNDNAGLPAPSSTDATTSEAPAAAAPAPAAAAPAPAANGLVKSEPVSTAGAVSLNNDCNVEGVDGVLFTSASLAISRQGAHEISGWVVNVQTHSIPQDLKLVVAGVGKTTGVWTAETPRWIERKGVAETRGYNAELNNSGFSFKVDTSELPAGSYHAYVISNADGVAICDPGRQITLSE